MSRPIKIEEIPDQPQPPESQPALDLIACLCAELDDQNILYCHWKSNAKLDRSASGENDLDLLVDRASVPSFTEILFRLGFKQAFDRLNRQMPGVLDFYGYDRASGKFVHVHAHYQLVLGHDATKNFRLPIERAYLASISQDRWFKVPAPEYEYILLVIRLMIKHSTWEVVLLRSGRFSHNEREELAYLQQRISEAKVKEILLSELPCINAALFDRCVQCLSQRRSWSFRLKAGRELRRQLNSSARRPAGRDIFLKFWRRLDSGLQRRVFKTSTKKRFGNGGLMIAIVGGDGSGKTTAIEGLYKWLKEEFEIKRLHLGKPAWSRTTILVRGILKIGRSLGFYPFAKEGYEYAINTDAPSFPGYPWLIREVCTARDRYLTYTRGRRFATNGGLVLCDRFPISAIKIMDGPQVRRVTKSIKSNRFIEYLARLEEKYYSQIMLPDLLMALRVDPEISVQRKTDESPESVRARAGEVWRADWAKTPAHMIDAGKSKAEVLSELKDLVWSHL